MRRSMFLVLIAALFLILAGCSGDETESTEPVAPEQPAAEVPAEAAPSGMESETPAEEAAEPAGEALSEAAPESAEDTAVGAVEELKEQVKEETAPVVEKAKEAAAGVAARIEAPATVAGQTRVGASKCKLCHKLQYNSWKESAHAELDPPLDCESCHGPGSLYKKRSIMKVRKLAEAAGLVLPKATFCTENCHTDDWTDDMLMKAHAHKAAS